MFDPWSGKIPHATEQLSPCTVTAEPHALRASTTEARVTRACAPKQEEPQQGGAFTPRGRVAPLLAATRERPCTVGKTQYTPKI